MLVPGCWKSERDFGAEGRASEEYKKLGQEVHTGSEWVVYYKNDGTLQALVDTLNSGPNGKREAALLQALQEHGILQGMTSAGENGAQDNSLPQKNVAVTDAGGGAEMKANGDGRPLRSKAEDSDAVKDEEQGYEWNELPNIGDLVWAQLGEGHKRAWYPVVVTEPPTTNMAIDDDAQTESDDDEEDTDEWQSTGSEYIGRRLLIEVNGRRGDKLIVPARVTGWVPSMFMHACM